jgi:hypothetical protein
MPFGPCPLPALINRAVWASIAEEIRKNIN